MKLLLPGRKCKGIGVNDINRARMVENGISYLLRADARARIYEKISSWQFLLTTSCSYS